MLNFKLWLESGITVFRGGELTFSPDTQTGIPAMFFTDSEDNAANYASGRGVHRVQLYPKNPLVVDCNGRPWLYFVDKIKEGHNNGNDVVILKNVGDNADPDDDKITTTYIVLDKTALQPTP